MSRINAIATVLLLSTTAHAQALESAKPDSEWKDLERRHQSWTMGGDDRQGGGVARHTFVAPLSSVGVPFEFAIPVAQLASRTHVGYSAVSQERNVDQSASAAHYLRLLQIYDVSFRFAKRAEVSASVIGEAASAIDSDSFTTGGAAGQWGGRVALAYRLVNLRNVAVTLRATGQYEQGYRVNVEPLLYNVRTNPLGVIGHFDGSQVGSPTQELDLAVGLGFAYEFSARVSLQASGRLDRLGSRLKPWLDKQGTEAAGARSLVYAGWSPSAALALGVYVCDIVLLQPQIGFAYRGETLTAPSQDAHPIEGEAPHARTSYVTPALQVMFVVNPVLQLGFGGGVEFGSTDTRDSYQNTYSTSSVSPFGQMIARYVPGWAQ